MTQTNTKVIDGRDGATFCLHVEIDSPPPPPIIYIFSDVANLASCNFRIYSFNVHMGLVLATCKMSPVTMVDVCSGRYL